MTVFCVRVPDELAARFDATAADAGGRSARLRQLIAETAKGEAREKPQPRRAPAPARLMVRLRAEDAAHVGREASLMQLSRAAWVAALVRRHASGGPTFSRRDEISLLDIQGELRRIGVNVNQIARALNTAVLEGLVLELELEELRALHRELRSYLLSIREAFEGNLAYWDAIVLQARSST